MPRPSKSTARLNRQKRALKVKQTNRKRMLAIEKLKKRRQAERDKIKKDKDFVRNEKLRIKEALKRQRLQLAKAKKQLAQSKKADKKVLSCSPDQASAISIAMARLVPTSDEITRLTHKQYSTLRTQMSKALSQLRRYAHRCNKTYVVEKRNKPKRPSPTLCIPNRQIFMPDIGVAVPDKCPVSEQAFAQARQRLQLCRHKRPVPATKKNRKRIAPTLVRV
ncbi:unnamed protein product [Ectocarpus sp. 6 AP-2014]